MILQFRTISEAALAAIVGKKQQLQMDLHVAAHNGEEEEDDGRIPTAVHNPAELAGFNAACHVDPIDIPSFHVSRREVSPAKKNNTIDEDRIPGQLVYNLFYTDWGKILSVAV